MKIGEFAERTGVSVRTLHYYDKIGLLQSGKRTDAGYRVYDDAALERLQQILFFRELDFPLSDIQKIISDPNYDRAEALRRQKQLLLQKRKRLDELICLAERTLKGENDMSFKQFDRSEIEETRKKYAAEVKARWGHTPEYAESEKRADGYTEEQWTLLGAEGNEILREFSAQRRIEPDRAEAQALVKRWREYITAHFYPCTKEILAYLGRMYLEDARFTAKIDQQGEGTAAFMAAAIAAYCAQQG